jgi:hypothetical protein
MPEQLETIEVPAPEMINRKVAKEALKLIEQIAKRLAMHEIGTALQSVLNTDMDTETKLSLISRYAESYVKGKMHDE